MSINKVVYDAKVLIDLTEDSINAEDLVKGVTAHNKKGEPITGTMPSVHDICGTYGTVTPGTMSGETEDTEVAIINTPKDNISLQDSFLNDITYGMIPQNGVNLRTIVEADKFGDVEASDVAKDKTFTSAAGVKVKGTCPILTDIQDANATISTNEEDSTLSLSSFSPELIVNGIIETKGMGVSGTTSAELSTKLSNLGDVTKDYVASGKTFTSVAGVNVAGTMQEAKKFQCTSFDIGEETTDSGTKYITFTPARGYPRFSPNADSNVELGECYITKAADLTYRLETSASKFGTATAADVASGKTFTSAAGLKITGTKTEIAYETADQIQGAWGKLSQNSRKLDGVFTKTLEIDSTDASMFLNHKTADGKRLIDPENVTVNAYAKLSDFGTATAADVASGKTFTSAAGLKITGTKTGTGSFKTQAKQTTPSATTKTITPDSGYDGLSSVTVKGDSNLTASNIKSGVSIFGVTGTYSGSSSGGSSNNNVEAYLVDVTNPTVSFKTNTGTIKVYGYATASTTSQWGGSTTTQYAFDGDGYYNPRSYGTPTKTRCTFGASNGKLTGLPTLNSGTLLVVRGI